MKIQKSKSEDILSPGIVMKASQLKVEKIPTGIIELDMLLDGGLRKGSLTQFSGGYSSGKSTMGLLTVASAQKQGLSCGWADVEGAFTPDYAAQNGVDLDSLLVMKGATTAQAYLHTIREWALTKTVSLAVMDSVVAAGAVQEIMDKKGFRDLDQETVAALARLWSKFLRTSWGAMHAKEFTFLCINQVRVSGLGTNVVTEQSTGGNALHHIARDEVVLRKKSNSDAMKWALGDTAYMSGHGISLKLAKSSSGGLQGRSIETQFIYMESEDVPEHGIASCLTLAHYAATCGTYKQGNTFTVAGKKAISKKAFWELVVDDEEVRKELTDFYTQNRAKIIKTETPEDMDDELLDES